jgi:hypothetical protein
LLVRGLNAPAATISTPLAAAWLTCAARAHNLLRVAGALASLAYGKARGATIRRDLIDVAARTARHGRGHITLHLPAGWYREHEWMTLFTATCGPPQQRPDQPDPGHCTSTALAARRPGPRTRTRDKPQKGERQETHANMRRHDHISRPQDRLGYRPNSAGGLRPSVGEIGVQFLP